MTMKLKLERPLAFFDIEATGLNRKTDRIVEIAIVKVWPDGVNETLELRINPQMPIPQVVQQIHGISDADVAESPVFDDVAREIADFLEDCDLSGYNLLYFDIPLLEEEFRRTVIPFSMQGRRVIDVQKIFHKKEPRDLSAAVAFYCDRPHDGAHGAMADALATYDVLLGQFEKYDDLPLDVDALDDYCKPDDNNFLDREGKLYWNDDNQVCINFGPHKGRTLRGLVDVDTQFLNWILRKDFSREVQDVVRNALAGSFPERKQEK